MQRVILNTSDHDHPPHLDDICICITLVTLLSLMSDNQDVWYDSSTVAYWDVITDLNTIGKGGLDLNTGQFTAGPLIIAILAIAMLKQAHNRMPIVMVTAFLITRINYDPQKWNHGQDVEDIIL